MKNKIILFTLLLLSKTIVLHAQITSAGNPDQIITNQLDITNNGGEDVYTINCDMLDVGLDPTFNGDPLGTDKLWAIAYSTEKDVEDSAYVVIGLESSMAPYNPLTLKIKGLLHAAPYSGGTWYSGMGANDPDIVLGNDIIIPRARALRVS